MKGKIALALIALAVGLIASPLGANPSVDVVSSWAKTDNLTALGFSSNPVPLETAAPNDGVFNSDLAFWGDMAVQGTYDGFRLIDVTYPSRPKEIINYEDCYPEGNRQGGNQGDVAIWGNLLVRASNSGASATTPQTCDGDPVPAGFEGVIVFDISNKLDPDVVAMVDLECGGSHTLTLTPDTANGRLIVYASASTGGCPGIDIVEIPLANPSASSFLRFEASGDIFSGNLVNFVDVTGLGTFAATGTQFHPDPTAAGSTGNIVLVNDGTATPTLGCAPLVGFPAGAIALIDRGPFNSATSSTPQAGNCTYITKITNAEAAGAAAVIVVHDTTIPATMGGETHELTIPAAMVSLVDGTAIKAALPTTGTVRRNPGAVNVARGCHDTAVILGDAMMVACAGGNGVSAWTIDPAKGGSLTDPLFLYSENHGTGTGHTAAFTWDGKYIVFGHEPGGGSGAQCQATSSEFNKTIFFLDAETGMEMGHFVNPRPQTNTENCTWHNGTVVPLKNKNGQPRYVWVSGNYQSGVSVVDFSDPENAEEIAFADPPPLINPDNPTGIELGGDWSTYWYNGRIYESDITRGLIIWRLDDPAVGTFIRTTHSNPQTTEFTIDK